MLLTNTKPLKDPNGTRLLRLLSGRLPPKTKQLLLLIEVLMNYINPLRVKHSLRRRLTSRRPSIRTLRSLTSTLLMTMKISMKSRA